jgi:hypothetical protein
MSLPLQDVLVALLVVSCALYSSWRLATVALRLKMLAGLARLPGLGRAAWLERLRQRTLARQLAACGGCARAPTPDAASRNRTPGALRR